MAAKLGCNNLRDERREQVITGLCLGVVGKNRVDFSLAFRICSALSNG